MKVARNLIVCLLMTLVLFTPALSSVEAAIAPLGAGTFPSGTIVVPMDGKQTDRIHVYGLIHEFLRLTPNSQVARIIEPPDVTMQTALTPSGDLYQGGPFLIDASFYSSVTAVLSNSTFSNVKVTSLTAPFTSDNIFFVKQPTRILVISDGYWGKTFLTLTRMGISYSQVTTDQILAAPSMVNDYTLIVLDAPGWYGNPGGYNPARRALIQAVYNTIATRVQSGNEVMFTDAALLDLNATFPGYITLGESGLASRPAVTVYNAPNGGFTPEFPSQYYNPGPKSNKARILTESGAGMWVPTGVQSAHVNDVRIVMDTTNYGYPAPSIPYAILAFYFPFGKGIVEGLGFQPYEELYPTYADYNGYYATYEIYGNKFVEGPQSDFILSATPSAVTIVQGQTATYTVGITSIGSFSSPISLQVSGTPGGSTGSFVPPVVTPSQSSVASSTLTVSTSSPGTPIGNYTLTITGSSSLPSFTHSVTVTLVVTAPPNDFIINAHPSAPTPLIVAQTQCGNYSVSIESVGNFNAPVNLTIIGVPGHVSHQFISNPITPSPGGTVFSTLEVCPDSAVPNNYTMTIMGTGGEITHTADIALEVPVPVSKPINWLVYLIIFTMLFLALGIGFLAVLLSRRGGTRGRRPRILQVLPIPTIRCRNCGRLMPIQSVYCPYCGKPQVIVSRRPPKNIMLASSPASGRRIIPFSLALVSGILVLLNGAALLSPSFYSFWSSIFFWMPLLDPRYEFALGVIIGLTLILGAIITLLRSGALADIIIFPFAIFSLLIGGGFIAGMVLGIIAGIIGALKR